MKTKMFCNRSLLLSLYFSVGVVGQIDASMISIDSFNGGLSSGTGLTGTWADINGNTIIASTTVPLANGVDNWYLTYGGNSDSFVHRNLSTPVSAATTPEVWIGAYMRSNSVSGSLFGLEVGPASGNVLILGTEGDQYVREGQLIGSVAVGAFAWLRSTTYSVVANQPELLVLRLYKSNAASSVYDLVDGYADVNGNDGRNNSLLPIVTGQSLAGHPISQLSYLGLDLSNGGSVDYVAVGTTQNDIVNVVGAPQVPAPSTLILLVSGALTILCFAWFNPQI